MIFLFAYYKFDTRSHIYFDTCEIKSIYFLVSIFFSFCNVSKLRVKDFLLCKSNFAATGSVLRERREAVRNFFIIEGVFPFRTWGLCKVGWDNSRLKENILSLLAVINKNTSLLIIDST